MKRTTVLLLSLAGLSAAFMGCTKHPLDHINQDESRIYITDYDSSVNFASYKTYSISDSVAVINNGSFSKQLDTVDVAYITAVNKYMQQQGYVPVSKTQKPDLGININRIITISTGVISYNDYWGDYGGYWDPYYWGYSGYGYYLPYTYGVYEVREGALSIDLLDLKNASSNQKINVIWTGLIRGSGIFDAQTADSQVQALFNQSPYLKTN